MSEKKVWREPVSEVVCFVCDREGLVRESLAEKYGGFACKTHGVSLEDGVAVLARLGVVAGVGEQVVCRRGCEVTLVGC